MPFVKQKNKDFHIKDNKIFLDHNYFEANKNKFKKITGSRFASIFEINKYTSPFKVWTTMVNIFKDVMDPTLSIVGSTIEPKLRDYASKHLNTQYLVYEPAKVKWDIFKDNDYFGGIPDGEPCDNNGKLDYSKGLMVEIKTSSADKLVYETINNSLVMKKDEKGFPVVKEEDGKKNEWFFNGKIVIPNEYRLQLGLYLYLRNQASGYFVIGFLRPEDYAKPEAFVAEDHEIHIVKMNIKRSEIEQYINYAKQWYDKYIKTGISPEMTENDKRWLKQEGIIND